MPQASTDMEKLKEAAGKFKEKASRTEIKRVKGGPWSWVSIFVVVFPPCLTSGTVKSGQIFGLLQPHSSHDQDVEPVLGVGDIEMSQNCWWDTKILSWGLSLPPNLVTRTLPPEAQREPSGETVTVFR